jgi:hypothetical protein
VKRLLAGAALGLMVCAASPAAAQFPLLQQPGQPGELLDPQELQPTRRAPLTITPSFTLSEEYNDNVLLDNQNRKSDFITGFTPGIAITFERPTYRLAAGYNFTAELFARETQESHAFDRQNFFLDTMWKVDPFLTLSLTDTFIFSTDTNLIAREQVSAGRDRALSNTLSGGVGYQLTEFWTLRGGASYTLERFSRQGLEDSDVYHVNVGADRRLSSRLSVGAGYEFGYFDIDNEEKTTTHTPRVGAVWKATDTITLALSGGPTVERREGGQTRVTPAITASYTQRVFFGAVGLSYDRGIGTASGFGGPTDNDLISGYVTVTTLMRGLTLQFLPRYSNVQSPDSDRIDIRAFTAALQATYRITDWVSVIGGYQFFHQRSNSTAVTNIGTAIANDADQNRVFFGLTLGYPIRID